MGCNISKLRFKALLQIVFRWGFTTDHHCRSWDWIGNEHWKLSHEWKGFQATSSQAFRHRREQAELGASHSVWCVCTATTHFWSLKVHVRCIAELFDLATIAETVQLLSLQSLGALFLIDMVNACTVYLFGLCVCTARSSKGRLHAGQTPIMQFELPAHCSDLRDSFIGSCNVGQDDQHAAFKLIRVDVNGEIDQASFQFCPLSIVAGFFIAFAVKVMLFA